MKDVAAKFEIIPERILLALLVYRLVNADIVNLHSIIFR